MISDMYLDMICMCLCTYIYIYVCVCMYNVCIYKCIYVCMMYVCINVYMYHTHTHTYILTYYVFAGSTSARIAVIWSRDLCLKYMSMTTDRCVRY